MTTPKTSSELKELMPVLARHEGVWEGIYRHYDKDGNKTDEQMDAFGGTMTSSKVGRPIWSLTQMDAQRS